MNCTGTERRREICSKYIVKPVLHSVCSENDNISSDAGDRKIKNEYFIFHLFDRKTGEYKDKIIVGCTAAREIQKIAKIELPPCSDLFFVGDSSEKEVFQILDEEHGNISSEKKEIKNIENGYDELTKELINLYVVAIFTINGKEYIESGECYRGNQSALFCIYCELLEKGTFLPNSFRNSLISRKIKALTTILLKFEINNIEDLFLRFSSKYPKSKRPNIKNIMKFVGTQFHDNVVVSNFFQEY